MAGATGEGNPGPRLRIEFLETENAALLAELRDIKLSRDNLLQVLGSRAFSELQINVHVVFCRVFLNKNGFE